MNVQLLLAACIPRAARQITGSLVASCRTYVPVLGGEAGRHEMIRHLQSKRPIPWRTVAFFEPPSSPLTPFAGQEKAECGVPGQIAHIAALCLSRPRRFVKRIKEPWQVTAL